MKKTCITLPEQLLNRLKKKAQLNGQSVSSLIRVILEKQKLN